MPDEPLNNSADQIAEEDPHKVEKLSKLGHNEEAKAEGDEAAEGVE